MKTYGRSIKTYVLLEAPHREINFGCAGIEAPWVWEDWYLNCLVNMSRGSSGT